MDVLPGCVYRGFFLGGYVNFQICQPLTMYRNQGNKYTYGYVELIGSLCRLLYSSS